eukprot:10562168-Alexandrium_andersonii.AAC.1
MPAPHTSRPAKSSGQPPSSFARAALDSRSPASAPGPQRAELGGDRMSKLTSRQSRTRRIE